MRNRIDITATVALMLLGLLTALIIALLPGGALSAVSGVVSRRAAWGALVLLVAFFHIASFRSMRLSWHVRRDRLRACCIVELALIALYFSGVLPP